VTSEHGDALWNSTSVLTDGKVWRSTQAPLDGTIAARRAAALRWMGWRVITVSQEELTDPHKLPLELQEALTESSTQSR
jgi:hypothetical protein